MIDETKYTKEVMPDGKIVFTPIPEKKAGLWRPADGEAYNFVTNCFETERTFNDPFQYWHKQRIAAGNCHPTSEQSDKAAPLLARASIFISAALTADPDAGEWAEDRKWTTTDGGGVKIDKYTRFIYIPTCVHTKEQAEHMLEILKAEGWK